MEVYFNYDDNYRIIEFSLLTNIALKHSYNLEDELIEHFTDNFNHYVFVNNTLKLSYDLDYIKNECKNKCSELFKLYIEHIVPKTKYENYINAVFRDELREYIKDNEIPTPVFDMYAKSLGLTDLNKARFDKYQEILHTDIALADLIAQKDKMYKFIDDCTDAELLLDFEPNFNFISYSNMRWR